MPNGENAWKQLQDRLHGSLSGYYNMSPELSTGGRQISVYRPGQKNLASFRFQWDEQTGRFSMEGMPVDPSYHPSYRSEGGVGAAAGFLESIYHGYDPKQLTNMQTELDPYVYTRRQIESGGQSTGGQALAPWAMKQQTQQFLGTHYKASYPYTDVAWGLDAPQESGWGQAMYSTSGVGRRGFEQQYGPLAYSAESLRTIPGYGVSGTDIRSPYKDLKDRARLDFVSPGVVPNLYGGRQTTSRMRGDLPGAEKRVGLQMQTEFVSGGIFPGAGQAYYKSDAFRGVEMGQVKDVSQKLSWNALRSWAEGGKPLGSAGRDLGFAGGTFGTLMGQELQMSVRGAKRVDPMGQGATLRLPQGPGLYSMLEQYIPETLSQLSGTLQVGPGKGNQIGPEVLQQTPKSPAQDKAYQLWMGQIEMLDPDWKYKVGGGLNIETYQGKPGARPSMYMSGEAMYGMQSGTGLFTHGTKMVGLGMESLTGMGAKPDTQLMLGAESAKGMPFLVGGLAQTLKQEDWAPYLGEGYQRHFDPQGNLIYGGMKDAPKIEAAASQMITSMRDDPAARERMQQAGVTYRQGWFNFPQGQDTAQALQRADRQGAQWQPGMEAELGMWRKGPGGRQEQFLESLAFKQSVTPFETFRGKAIGQSLSELTRTYEHAPGQFESLFKGGQAERTSYSSLIMAAAGRFPKGTQPLQAGGGMMLPTARAQEIATTALGKGNVPSQMPLQYMLQAMAESPKFAGKFMDVGGGAFVPPPEAALQGLGFQEGQRGDPQASWGWKLQNLLGAVQTGEGISESAQEWKQSFGKFVSESPSVWNRATGGTIPESEMGRAFYLGGDPTGEGRTGVVLPDAMKALGLGEGDLAKIIRYPTETGPETTQVLGNIMYATEYSELQKKAGLDPVDPSQIKSPGLFGSGFDLADILKVDIDKDLFGTIMMRGAVSGNPMFKEMFANAAREARSVYGVGDPRMKSVDAASPTNLTLSDWVASKPGLSTSAGAMRESRGIDAIMKQRVGLAHNMQTLLGYYTAKGGGDPDTRKSMLRGLGILKQEYIDLSKGLIGSEDVLGLAQPTAKATFEKGQSFFDPMTTRAFMGKGQFGRMSSSRWGSMSVKGNIVGRTEPNRTMEHLLTGFVEGGLDMLSGTEGNLALETVVGALGGGVGEGGEITGLPPAVSGYIQSVQAGAKPSTAREALYGESGIFDWFEQTPIGAMARGRMVAGGMGAAFQTQRKMDLGQQTEEWERTRTSAIQGQIKARPQLAAEGEEYLMSAVALGIGSRRGPVYREGRTSKAMPQSAADVIERVVGLAGQTRGTPHEKVISMLPLGEIEPTQPSGVPVAPPSSPSTAIGSAPQSAPPSSTKLPPLANDIWAKVRADKETASKLGLRPVYNAPFENEGNSGWGSDSFDEARRRAKGDLSKVSVAYVTKKQYNPARERAIAIDEERQKQPVVREKYQYTQWSDTDIKWTGIGDPIKPSLGAGISGGDIGVPPGGGPPAPPATAGAGDFPPKYWRVTDEGWKNIGGTISDFLTGGEGMLEGSAVRLNEYIRGGGSEVMDPFTLQEMSRALRHGAPMPKNLGRQALRTFGNLQRAGLGDRPEMVRAMGMLKTVGQRSLGESLAGMPNFNVKGAAMASALGGGMGGLGGANIDMLMAGVPATQAMSIDRAVQAETMLGFQQGFGTITQKGQLMKAWEGLGGRPGTQAAAQNIQNLIEGTQWRGKLPSYTQGQAGMINQRQVDAESGKFMPDASGGMKQFAKNIQEANVRLERRTALRKSEEGVWKASKGLEKVIGPGGAARFMEELGAQPSAATGRMYRTEVGFARQRLEEAQEGLGITQGMLGLEGQERGVGGAFHRATGGRFQTGKKFMSFFDLMYMRRVGQIFWGGMEGAGLEAGQQQQAMMGGMYQGGMGGVMQDPTMATQAALAQSRRITGQAFNQMWDPFRGAMAGAQGAGGPLPALAGPAIGAGFLASYFLPGVAAAGPLAMAGAAIVGGAGYAHSQTTSAGRARLGFARGADIVAEEEPGMWDQIRRGMGATATAWQEGMERGGVFQAGAAASQQLISPITGVNTDAASGYFEDLYQKGGVAGQVISGGYKATDLKRLSPAMQMAAVNQRATNLITRADAKGLKLDPQLADQLALQMTTMSKSGLNTTQENRIMDAAIMNLDPYGLESKAYYAETGLAVTPMTDLGALERTMSTPQSAAQIEQFISSGGAQMSDRLKGMGVQGLDWAQFPSDWASYMTAPWEQVASTLAGRVTGGRMTEEDYRRALVTEPTGRRGGRGEVRAREKPVAYTGFEAAAIAQAGGYEASMAAGGLGYVQQAMQAGRGIKDQGYQADLSRFATGGGVARSEMAANLGMPWLQTHDEAGFGVLQVSPSGFGVTPEMFAGRFAELGVQDTAYAQGFMGDASVSALTGEAIGGTLGAQYAQQDQAYQNQRSQLGIQGAMMALRRQYTSGEGMPGGRGLWQVSDDMTSLARQQQTYQWQVQGQRMEMQEQQFAQTWGANVSQFETRTEWQREDFARSAQKTGMQRGWAREDWAQSSAVREMQWGWQQEDFGEEVRFATGRQRQQMERQQERDVTMYNIEGEQIDKEKGRQEELWALQDEQFEIAKSRHEEQTGWQEERFERQREFFDENMELNKEAHEKNLEFMHRRWALEDEQRKMSREMQEKMWDLQQASLGLQYQRLEEQKKEQEAAKVINELFLTAHATNELAKASSMEAKRQWMALLRALGGGGGSGGVGGTGNSGSGQQETQLGFSGMITKPTTFLVGEGGAPEFVEVRRQGAGGIPEAMGRRDGGAPISVVVLIDGEEVAAKVMIDRGNNLRVEAYR